jgi:glycosyltransferase involved in cell wall biosynthesis
MFDIVVGIPSYSEADTIKLVVQMIDRGLSLAFSGYSAVIVNADNESQDGTKQVFLGTDTNHEKVYINTGANPRGKGINVLAILEYARQNAAQCVGLFDADVRSIQRNWVADLLRPVLRDAADLVTPIYTRNQFEGNTTNHIVYPYTYAIFNKPIRQPIAGEFGLSKRMYGHILSLKVPESALKYGIDVFLTGNALMNDFEIHQVTLSRKIHNPGFPKIVFMSRQVIDTMFRVFLRDKRIRSNGTHPHAAESVCTDSQSVFPDAQLINDTQALIRRYLDRNRSKLKTVFPELDDNPLDVRAGTPPMDMDLWCNILAGAYVRLAPRTLARTRDGLVALYLCRVFTYWNEIKGLGSAEIDEQLYKQAVLLRNILTSAEVGAEP